MQDKEYEFVLCCERREVEAVIVANRLRWCTTGRNAGKGTRAETKEKELRG